MKTISRLTSLSASVTMAALMAFGTLSVNAADPAVRGKHAAQVKKPAVVWSHVETLADAEAVMPGDSIAMACPKCKTISVTSVTQDTKTKTRLIAGDRHTCPGCASTITVVGDKAHNKQVVKHVCKACGDESAFCCVTKHGGEATKGMEKDKK